jgi:type IV pilus assembly protein PilV
MKKTRNRPQNARVNTSKSKGFTLLEALVSILLLSVGALGVAGLQAISLKNTRSADQRAAAAHFAQMMVDEAAMRRAETVGESPTIVDDTFVNVPCTAAAANSISEWRRQLDCAIPGAKGSTSYDSGVNRLIVRVQWDDSRGLGGSANEEFLLDTRL